MYQRSIADADSLNGPGERASASMSPFNEHLHALVDSLPALTSFWDSDLKCRFANRAYAQWFSVDVAQMLGMPLQTLLGPELFALNEPMIDGALAGEEQQFELLIPGADGVSRQTLATYLPSTFDGAPGFIAQVVEINRLKEVEALLKIEIADHTRELADGNRSINEHQMIEKAFRQTLDLTGQIPWSITADGSASAVHPLWLDRWTDWIGGEASGTLDGAIELWFHPDDRERGRSNVVHSITHGEMSDHRYRFLTRDGSYRWLRFRSAPCFDSAGVLTQWLGTIEDVDELHRAEERVRENEAAYRLTLDLSGQIPWAANADGSEVMIRETWAERWEALTGLKIETTVINCIMAAMHPDDVDRITRDTVACFATGRPIEQRYRLLYRDGTSRWFRSRAKPLRDEQGAIIRWYGTIEDIDEQVLEEEWRQERDAAYRLTVELSGQIPWTTTADGTSLVVPSAVADRWAALTGRAASETVAEYRAAAIHPADLERIHVSRAAAIAAGNQIDLRYRLRMADGDYRWWHSRASPLLDRQGEVVRWYGTLEDIHDRVLEEERVRRLETELVHFGRLAAINSLASTLAHELNQPLAAVMNYVNGARRLLASGDVDQVVAIDSALEAAATSTMLSAQIIRSLRDMVAKGAVNRCEESLARIVEHACLLAIPDAKSNVVEIGIRIAPGLTTIHVDRVQFNQVLINLLRNAIEAVEARPVRKITVEARRAAGVVEISVADTGVGVAANRVDKLFEAFNSTKTDGLGIGLSISRTIVEANGGKLNYAAAPDGGACFTITIPDIC